MSYSDPILSAIADGRVDDPEGQASARLALHPIWDLRAGLIVGAEVPPLWDERAPETDSEALQRVHRRAGLLRGLARILRDQSPGAPGFRWVSVDLPMWLLSRKPCLEKVSDLLRRETPGSARWTVDVRAAACSGSDPTALLRALGVSGLEVALDHVGLGTHLSILQRPEVRHIKLDASLIQARERHRVQEVLDVARRQGLQTVALGVEDPRDAELLKLWGCRYGQGSLLLGPQPVRRLLRWTAGTYQGHVRPAVRQLA